MTLVAALADGELELPRRRPRRGALPGFGPWTVELLAMRGLGDPDAFLHGDLGVVRAAQGLDLPSTPAAFTAAAEA